MPFVTRHYQLEAHTWGERASASRDRRRFTIIDNEMAFVSDQIGQGRIEGWQVASSGWPNLTVSPGFGIIGRKVNFSYGDYDYTLSPDKTYYVYMKSRNVLGGHSGFSNLVTVSQTITAPPDSVINSRATSITSYAVTLAWDANTEPDLEKYKVERSHGFNVTSFDTTGLSFVDTTVDQNTIYTYRVLAVNLSGIESSTAVPIPIHTPKDLTPPVNPVSFYVFLGDQMVQMIWGASPSHLLSSYRIEVQSLDEDYDPTTDDPIVATITDLTKSSTSIESLVNGTSYKVTIYAVSTNGVLSDGLSQIVRPASSTATSEVTDMTVTPAPVESTDKIELLISWSYSLSFTYGTVPDKFIITIIENGSTGITSSIPIEYLGTDLSTLMRLFPYEDTPGHIAYKSIESYTTYYIRIQAEDSSGNKSNGMLSSFKTPIFLSPTPPINLGAEKQRDNSIYYYWDASTSDHIDYYTLRITTTDLSMPGAGEVTLLSETNVGLSHSYVIPSAQFDKDTRYAFYMKSVDMYGNVGDETYYLFSTDSTLSNEASLPAPPNNQSAVGKDREVVISWSPDTTGFIKYYQIWRAPASTMLAPTDFTLIQPQTGSLPDSSYFPSSVSYFHDFEVTNGTGYAYFVSSVDVFDRQSINPTNSPLLMTRTATPHTSSSFSLPTGLGGATAGNFDVHLTWDTSTAGDFDGYQIFRSKANKYSFEPIAFVNSAVGEYTDYNALLVSDQPCYYLIQKFKDECNPFLSVSTSVVPADSIPLAVVTTTNGVIYIDDSVAYDLDGLHDLVLDRTETALNAHKHAYTTKEDRRINLRSNIIVTDWATTDYQRYTTETDIEGASNYVVRVFVSDPNDINSEFFKDETGAVNAVLLKQAQLGNPAFTYEIDGTNGILTFQTPLYTTCVEPTQGTTGASQTRFCPVVPYKVPPTIIVEPIGISEVQGQVTRDQIKSISATQVTTGDFAKAQLPTIKHEGRIKDILIPTQKLMISDDGFLNVFRDNTQMMGDATAFYDLLRIGTTAELLSATSRGVMYSSDNGSSWSVVGQFPYPATRVFYSPFFDMYICLTTQAVYASESGVNGYTAWHRMSGLENIKIIRDWTEDTDGNIYISTDLGIYKLYVDKAYVKYTWEQQLHFGPRSTEAYGIFYDDYYAGQTRVIVSNELGILESVYEPLGYVSYFTTEISEQKKIHRFIRQGSYLFGLSDNCIWRKTGQSSYDSEGHLLNPFAKVSQFDTLFARQMIISGDRLYITTDSGLMASSPNANIYTSSSFEMLPVWPELNIKGVAPAVTCLKLMDSDVFIGSESRLHFVDSSSRLWVQYQEPDAIIPSVYLDKELQMLGFYYNNGSYNNMSFDSRTDVNSVVTVANDYNTYVADNTGWAAQKYDAKINVYVNSSLYGYSGTISPDLTQFESFVFPPFTVNNSSYDNALASRTSAQAAIDALVEIEGTIPSATVTDVFSKIELFLSQLDDRGTVLFPTISTSLVKDVTVTGLDGATTTLAQPAGVVVDITKGIFTFSSAFDKYDDLRVDVIGAAVVNAGQNTHREIEDAFELVNSGLASGLSQVQQSNIVKLGIFNEKTWPGQQPVYSGLYQSTYMIPRSTSQYDKLNSTLDYLMEESNTSVGMSMACPSTVCYIASVGKICIGGKDGILVVDTGTLEIDQVTPLNLSDLYVRQLTFIDNVLYAVTSQGIFYSTDFATTWAEGLVTGLPDDIYQFAFVGNNFVAGCSDGVYFRSQTQDEWIKSFSSTNPVEIMSAPDILFLIVDNDVYISANAVSFTRMTTAFHPQINCITKFRSTIYVGTNEGLYSDHSSFYSTNPVLSLVDLFSDTDLSETLVVTDFSNDDENLFIALSDGTYVQFSGSKFNFKEFSFLDTIQKISIIDGEVWMFGYDLMQTPLLSYPVRLSTGVPV